MIINNALSAALAVAADKSIPQEGDDVTVVPSTIVPTETLLGAHDILQSGVGAQANNSFVTSFERLRAASTGATADSLVVLPRGLWTITWNLDVDFQTAGAVGQPVAVKLLQRIGADTQNIVGVFRRGAPLNTSGRFRLLVRDTAELRLDIVATGVGDAIDTHVCLNGEKNI
jgi:hypothetical protein